MGNDHFDKMITKVFTGIKETNPMAKKKFRDIVTRRLNVSTYEFKYQDYKESLIKFKNSEQEFLSIKDQVQIIQDKISEWINKGNKKRRGHIIILLIVYFKDLDEDFKKEVIEKIKITEKEIDEAEDFGIGDEQEE